MSQSDSSTPLVASAGVIALGIAVAGFFISQTLYNSQVAVNTAQAKGLAERRVKADRANWSVHFMVKGAQRSDIPSLYAKAESQQKQIVDLLKEESFDESEIKVGVISYYHREFRDKDQKLVDQSHELSGSILIETTKVDQISKARASVNRLIAEGIDISNHKPSYHFTKLNEIKPDMLKEAARNARIAASEFAQNAGARVGGIRSARQGSFFVQDAGERHGDTRHIEKDVRVVTTIEFYLE